MSRFYANIQGSRGETTRQGNKNISGHIRGWDVGVSVSGFVNDEGEDEFAVYLTSGSHGHKNSKLIGSFTKGDLEDFHMTIKPKEEEQSAIPEAARA